MTLAVDSKDGNLIYSVDMLLWLTHTARCIEIEVFVPTLHLHGLVCQHIDKVPIERHLKDDGVVEVLKLTVSMNGLQECSAQVVSVYCPVCP